MNDIEILKEYLQYKLDSGFHKLFYNDLDWEIKTIDCINAINNLQQENEQLKLQNFNLREDIMIQKKSFPNKEIKDKTFYDLYDMPTYEQLKDRIDKANDKIDKAIDKLICCGEMLDARFQSDMLDILEESDNNDE